MASRTVKRLRIGVAVGILALVLLGAITEDVVNRDPLTRFDSTVLETLHQHTSPAGLAVFVVISRLGSPLAMTMLALAGVLVLATRREWIVLGGWVAAFAGVGMIDRWLKLAIHRPRPVYASSLLHHTPSWSFPSGHAMGSLIGYGMLAYVLLILGVGRGNRRQQLMIVAGAALLIFAIGASRLYLGMHYLSDVVGGYAAGLVWLATCLSAVEIGRHWRRRALQINPTS